MTAYYNEFDPHAAAWLRELIAEGHIANGVVDTRSIEDVLPADLAGFTQCHFFAGIGGWSLALRLAGWPDDRPVWTGSCPCQPFSTAGQGAGFADERHLWPAFHHLISQRRPDIVFGEQVANALPWLDLVQTDLEGEEYAVAKAIIGAHSVGAPHIRQRLYWVADNDRRRWSARGQGGAALGHGEAVTPDCSLGELGHTSGGGSGRDSGTLSGEESGTERSVRGEPHKLVAPGWADCDWLPCRDGKSRPVESAAIEMANGLSRRMANVLPSTTEEIEKEIDAAPCQADYGKTLRILWETLLANPQRSRETGRFYSVSEEAVLLAFVRQLALQGWTVAKSVPCPGSEEEKATLRSVLGESTATRPSRGRELAEQQRREFADAVHFLSSILARHAQAHWAETLRQNAKDRYPLAHGFVGRVGAVRGFGNAIVPAVAAKFIEAFDTLDIM